MLLQLIKKILSHKKLLLLWLFVIVGLNLLYPSHDTDLGWHLRYGEYLIKFHKFLHQDIFSWTMSGYSWFSLSWLYDAFVYLLFSKFGFVMLSIVSSLIFVVTFYLIICPFRHLSFKVLFVCGFIYILILNPMAGPGLRPQLLALLFIALINTVIYFAENKSEKLLFFLPLIMLFWANLHGTFIFGFVQIIIYLGVKTYEIILIKKSSSKKLLTILFKYSILFGFVISVMVFNPQGFHVFSQVISYSPSALAKGVNEWYPIPRDSDMWIMLICWTILMVYILLKDRKSISGLYKASIILFFAYLAFGSRRMIAPYFVVTLPFFISYFFTRSKEFSFKAIDILIIFVMLVMTYGGVKRIPAIFIDWNKYCELNQCSAGAIKYVSEKERPERMLNFYNYGGVMTWLDRNNKIFIDGRMDQWKENNFSAFINHNKIFYDDDLPLFEKYSFDLVIVPQTMRLAYYLMRQSKDNKWKIAYEDNMAVVFVKIK